MQANSLPPLSPVGEPRDRPWRLWVQLATVLMIVVVCSGILMPAIVHVREAAARAQCANNLRQVGLSLHSFHDTNGKLPPALGWLQSRDGPKEGKRDSYGNVFFFLTPYIEASNLWSSTRSDEEGVPMFAPWRADAFKFRWKTYVCPADPGVGAGFSELGWAYGSYAYNAQVFATVDAKDRLTDWWGAARLTMAADGASNTILIAEKYARCGEAGTLWADWEPDYWQPVFAAWVIGPSSRFQVQPDRFENHECDPLRASTGHRAGINVCLEDATVRTVSPTLKPGKWWEGCRPAGWDGVIGPAWWE